MHTYIPISPPSFVSLPPSSSHPSRWSQSTELISLCYAARRRSFNLIFWAHRNWRSWAKKRHRVFANPYLAKVWAEHWRRRVELENPVRRPSPQSKASQERTFRSPFISGSPITTYRDIVETTDTVFSSLMLLCSWIQIWLSTCATFLYSPNLLPRDTTVSRWNWGYFL